MATTGLVLASAVLVAPALGPVVVPLAAAVTMLACAAPARTGGPTARGWWWVAAAVGTWAGGLLLWTLVWRPPFPGPVTQALAQVGPSVYLVPALWALWLLRSPDREGIVFARQILDGLIVAGSALFVAWIGLRRLDPAGGGGGAEQWVTLAVRPAAGALLTGTVLIVGLAQPAARRGPWAVGFLGVLTVTVTSWLAVAAPGPSDPLRTAPAAGWTVGVLLIGLAALLPATRRPDRSTLGGLTQDGLPYLAAAVAVAGALLGDVLHDPLLVAGGVALMLLVAGRYLLVHAERRSRTRRLERSLERRSTELGGARSHLRQTFDESPIGVVAIGPDGVILEANPAFGRLLRADPADLAGRSLPDLTAPEQDRDGSSLGATLARIRAGTDRIDPVEERYRAFDGSDVWVQQTVGVYRDPQGAATTIAVQVVDITAARAALLAQARQTRFLDATMENLDSAVIACDAGGRVILMNRPARELLQVPAAPWLPPGDWSDLQVLLAGDGRTPVEPDELPLIRALRGEDVRDAELVVGTPDGERRVLLINGRQIRDLDGDGTGPVLGAVVCMTDVTDRREAEAALVRQGLHDPLTDLANRALLRDRLTQAIARQDRQPDPFALLLLDLDGFKLVNDSLGHQAGDEVLVAIAHRFQGCLRASDTIARLGGDEFAVLLENTTGPEAVSVAEQLLTTLRRPVRVEQHAINPDASVGIALSTGRDTAESMLRNADLAMYAAKDAGKGVIEVFRAAMHDSVLQRLIMDSELRRAVEQEQFAVYYQPTFSLVTGRLCGFEALLRWRHPAKGEIPPCSFIPLAESTGLIVPLGRWVLEQACRQAARWRTLVGPTDPLLMSVNLSVRQLHDPGLTDVVLAALRDAGLEPGGLQLEITESIFDQRNEIVGVLGELHRAGVKLAIDDFGTGYSSLSRLHILPIDRVKVDRSFVELLADGNPAPLVAATISMAHSLGMQTTAEGIESADQLPLLRLYGCDDGQGYHFGRPMTASAATEVIREHLAGRRPAVTPPPFG
ncbi:EAL domain-containing protein [Nakamurella sp.]|uniref:EAL domain-containing protein n=1 Tax=Nakamurella sp. TaxID=1869182 RepID=UPI003B3AF63E